MTNSLQTTVNEYIESNLVESATWREIFDDLAILHALDLSFDLDGSIIGDSVLEAMTEEGHEVEESDLEGLFKMYMNEFAVGVHPSWFSVKRNLKYATKLVINNGADEDCITDFIAANS